MQLLGPVEQAEIDVLYANAACFVAHSFLEAFPQTPYEAMLYRKPVVASDIPSHREVCGDYAVFYPPEHPDLLAAAVGYALANSGAPRQLPPLARRTWSAHADEFASLLMAVASDRPPEVIRASE